jgi:hypothetical protein
MVSEELRRVSVAIFRNAYFLEVAAAIGEHPKERFIQRDLVRATGIEKGLVATVVRRLRAGLLIEPLTPEGREQPFVRHPSPLWRHAVGLRDELTDF